VDDPEIDSTIESKPLSRLLTNEFQSAMEFSNKSHGTDIEWMKSREHLITDFDDFFENYVYVVVASGFRAIHAARLTPKLVACKGDVNKMLPIFGNRQKVEAIGKVWAMRKNWAQLRRTFRSPEDLTVLPRIGPTVKWHLARNIGLISCGKPDLHLVRYAKSHHWADSQKMTAALAKEYHLTVGVADFMLWIWLSHGRGKKCPCCNGGYPLR